MDSRTVRQIANEGIVSPVAVAASYARRLVNDEQRMSGANVRAAIASVARKMKRPTGTVWNLLFRAPKEVSHELFTALEEAIERKVERQIKDLENELAAIRASRRRLRPGVVEEVEASIASLRAALREDAPC